MRTYVLRAMASGEGSEQIAATKLMRNGARVAAACFRLPLAVWTAGVPRQELLGPCPGVLG
jgi:hypothetical protein